MAGFNNHAEVNWEKVSFRPVTITLKSERALEMLKEILNKAAMHRDYCDMLCPGFARSLLERLPDRTD